ncbi:MAG: tyrosine-protein phosphatase [Prevotellaceae bacterium]|jgi:protein-tyrosine phosphatase|nr:tyrosine-protein phosphatase [Prevotellaceae bacterium]
MHHYLLNSLWVTLLLASCGGATPHITVVCEENNVGNCIVKWEMSPRSEGMVKVYASLNPNDIPEKYPVATAPIANQRMTIVTSNPNRRYYYTLLFNDKYRVKVATRNVNIPGIQNFRDLGGYQSYTTHKQTRWGMLYRSAQVDMPGFPAYRELQNMGIKTIIDLRTFAEQRLSLPPPQDTFNVVHIPLQIRSIEHILTDIRDHRIKSDTVYRIAEQMNRDLIKQHPQAFRQIFDVLLNADNYPVMIHCTSGNGRTGVVTALILAAIGVDDDVIMSDYLLSNSYFDIPRASSYAYSLPVRSQEAVTMIYSSRESYIKAAFNEAEREEGSIEDYLLKAVGLSKSEIKQLQYLLLESAQ